jgi:hypothetical protein
MQDGKQVTVDVNYDKAIWSGLSWAVAEIPVSRLKAGITLDIRCSTIETPPICLKVMLYHVEYNEGIQ